MFINPVVFDVTTYNDWFVIMMPVLLFGNSQARNLSISITYINHSISPYKPFVITAEALNCSEPRWLSQLQQKLLVPGWDWMVIQTHTGIIKILAPPSGCILPDSFTEMSLDVTGRPASDSMNCCDKQTVSLEVTTHQYKCGSWIYVITMYLLFNYITVAPCIEWMYEWMILLVLTMSGWLEMFCLFVLHINFDNKELIKQNTAHVRTQ